MTNLQSEEDLALKQQLELYVERVQDGDPAIQKMALEAMRYAVQHPFTFGWCPAALLSPCNAALYDTPTLEFMLRERRSS